MEYVLPIPHRQPSGRRIRPPLGRRGRLPLRRGAACHCDAGAACHCRRRGRLPLRRRVGRLRERLELPAIAAPAADSPAYQPDSRRAAVKVFLYGKAKKTILGTTSEFMVSGTTGAIARVVRQGREGEAVS